MKFFLTVGNGTRHGPFTCDFKEASFYECGDIDKKMLKMLDGEKMLSITLEIAKEGCPESHL